MKKLIIVLLALVFTANISLAAAKWVEVDNKTYIDLNSVRKSSSGYYTFYIKALRGADLAPPNVINKPYWYVITQLKTDCSSEKFTIMNEFYYDLKQNVIQEYTQPYDSDILPDSVADYLINDRICKAFKDVGF